MWDFSAARKRLFGGENSESESDIAPSATDGGTQQVVAPDAEDIALSVPDGVDTKRVEAALASASDTDTDGGDGTSGTVGIEAAAASESTVTPVASGHEDTLADTLYDFDREWWRIQDDKIQNIEDNSVRYSQQVGQWILETDDLVPGVLSRLKGLLLGAKGLTVEPADPDDDADQRLAEHLRGVYERGRGQPPNSNSGDADVGADVHIDPAEVVDAVLAENVTNGLFVGRSTDLQHLDLTTLGHAKDGNTGEEVYIQEAMNYTTVEVGEDGSADVGTDSTGGERALRIGEDVFDVQLYRSPPLAAIANDVVNKIQLKRLKGRKAEIASIGGLYITVRPPEYLPETDYEDRIAAENNPLGDEPIRKLELALQQDIERALETLQDYQSATIMSVPDHWEVSTIDLPEMDETFDDMIRGYNQAIARRLLFPLDLLELEKGSELSRDTMMQTLLNVIAGWQGDLATLFDGFAAVQRDIHNMSGEVDHRFPSVGAEDEKQIVQLLNFAGLLGMSESEARQLVNSLEGVDLDESPDQQDGDLPPAGGPSDPDKREQSMREQLGDRGDGGSQPTEPEPPDDGGPQNRGGQQAVEAQRAGVSHTFPGPDTLREAAQHVRRLVEDQLDAGQTVEMTRFSDDHFAVLVRTQGGRIDSSLLVRRSSREEGADEWGVVGNDDFFPVSRPLLADDSTGPTYGERAGMTPGMEEYARQRGYGPGTSALEAASFGEGDVVEYDSEGHVGVVLEVHSSDFTPPEDDADEDSYEVEEGETVYVVARGTEGFGYYTGDELTGGEFPDTPGDPASDLADAVDEGDVEAGAAYAEATEADADDDPADLMQADGVSGWVGYPPSWEKSEIPARIILLNAWTSMGASWTGAYQTFQKGNSQRGARKLASSMKDEVYGTTYWR